MTNYERYKVALEHMSDVIYNIVGDSSIRELLDGLNIISEGKYVKDAHRAKMIIIELHDIVTSMSLNELCETFRHHPLQHRSPALIQEQSKEDKNENSTNG